MNWHTRKDTANAIRAKIAGMNEKLSQLAADAGLERPEREALRLAFGLACAERVAHLLEEPEATECLAALRDFVAGRTDVQAFAQARERIARVAGQHRGSQSIDGTAHAAVSATYAVANALAGRAEDAAGYAAYATVYAYGGYAVTDPTAFESEFDWQVGRLRELLGAARAAA